MLRFSRKYFAWAVMLFVTEVLIALYVRDRFVRPYVGDYLVVILIYCFIRAFLNVGVNSAAIFVLALSYSMEILQYLNIAERLGYNDSRIARTVLGHAFEWIDLLAYTLGIATVLTIERFFVRKT